MELLVHSFKSKHKRLSNPLPSLLLFFKKILFIYFRERGREGEREGEKQQCVVASYVPPIGDLAHN